MKSLKIVGFILLAIGIAYGIVGLVQKSEGSKTFLQSFLVAGGMLLTGLMAIVFSFSNRSEE